MNPKNKYKCICGFACRYKCIFKDHQFHCIKHQDNKIKEEFEKKNEN